MKFVPKRTIIFLVFLLVVLVLLSSCSGTSIGGPSTIPTQQTTQQTTIPTQQTTQQTTIPIQQWNIAQDQNGDLQGGFINGDTVTNMNGYTITLLSAKYVDTYPNVEGYTHDPSQQPGGVTRYIVCHLRVTNVSTPGYFIDNNNSYIAAEPTPDDFNTLGIDHNGQNDRGLVRVTPVDATKRLAQTIPQGSTVEGDVAFVEQEPDSTSFPNSYIMWYVSPSPDLNAESVRMMFQFPATSIR